MHGRPPRVLALIGSLLTPLPGAPFGCATLAGSRDQLGRTGNITHDTHGCPRAVTVPFSFANDCPPLFTVASPNFLPAGQVYEFKSGGVMDLRWSHAFILNLIKRIPLVFSRPPGARDRPDEIEYDEKLVVSRKRALSELLSRPQVPLLKPLP